MNGIPDPGGVSGTFAALDRHQPAADLMFEFDGAHIRVIRDETGEPLFVASDIARALGYRDAANLTRRLDEDERGTRTVSTPGGGQTMTVITEAGLYGAILGSQVEGAARFKRWVKHEVLPTVRRTGSYSARPAAPTQLPSKKELAQWVIAAEERAETAEQLARELTPPAAAYQELVDADGDYSVADAAKVLSRDPSIDIRERRLFEFMAGEGWVFRRAGRWKAYSTAVVTGRLAEKAAKPFWSEARNRMVNAEPTVRVTPKGLMELRARLCTPTAGTQLALVVDQ